MKNKTSKTLLNGVLLAAMAAVGITAYQLITSPVEENEIIPNEIQVELNEELDEEPESTMLVDAGTTNVTADVEDQPEKLPVEEAVEPSAFEFEEAHESDENQNEQEAASLEIPESEDDMDLYDAAETSALGVSIPPAAYLQFSENTLMEWPVHGNILLDYDMDQTTYFPTLDQYRLNPAIAVQAVENAPVVASVDGVVYEISDDPRTGTTVTMELGNGYQAIYGQLKDLTVFEGQTVERGTTIGYINTPTKYYSEEGTNLYFAMKKDGQPLDPILYLP